MKGDEAIERLLKLTMFVRRDRHCVVNVVTGLAYYIPMAAAPDGGVPVPDVNAGLNVVMPPTFAGAGIVRANELNIPPSKVGGLAMLFEAQNRAVIGGGRGVMPV